MPHRFEHPPHLTVAPFANRDLQHALALPSPIVQQRSLGRERPAAVERDAVPQLA